MLLGFIFRRANQDPKIQSITHYAFTSARFLSCWRYAGEKNAILSYVFSFRLRLACIVFASPFGFPVLGPSITLACAAVWRGERRPVTRKIRSVLAAIRMGIRDDQFVMKLTHECLPPERKNILVQETHLPDRKSVV